MTSPARSNLSRLVRQEVESSMSPDNMRRTALHDSIHNNVWRQMVVEWCYQVVDHISADRELVYITINILDRFLAMQVGNEKSGAKARNYLTDKKAYETAVMTSLLITLKLQGLNTLCIGDLVKMSSNTVTTQDITETGKEIVHSLSWNNQIPTSARFAHAYVQLLPEHTCERAKMSLFENAVFQIELSVQDEYCSNQPPSLVAWMALENALALVDLDLDSASHNSSSSSRSRNSSSCISPESKNSLRSEISKATGHKYCVNLRRRLQKYQQQSHPSPPTNETSVHIIPPDDDEDEVPAHNQHKHHGHQPQSQTSATTDADAENVLTLRSRPMTESHSISLDDMTSIPSLSGGKVKRKEHEHEHSSLVPIRPMKRVKREI